MAPGHDPYAALRHRDYRCLLGGNMLARIGTEMQTVAVGWELYERTRSATALGLVGLVEFVPVFFLSLPAGHVADRYSRKGLLLAAQGSLLLSSLGLALLSYNQGPVHFIYLCLLFVGLSRSFSSPARWALVPQIVPERVLENAVTWNTSGWQIASMIGPGLGGAVVALASVGAVYVSALCCSLASALLLLPIRPSAPGRPARSREPATLRSLLEGVRFVWQTKLILATITLDLFAVLLGGATALLPIYASDILQVGPTGLGWLRAAPSIGALLMALYLAHRPPLQRAGPTLLWAVAGFGVATVVFGLSRNPILSFIMLALTGALDDISMVVRGTLVQVLTPDELRGRVSAVNAVFIGSSNELGAFESGITAQWFGPVLSVVGGGIGTVLVVLVVVLRWPEVARLGALQAPTSAQEEEMAQGEQPAPRAGP
jgi:MFS family permease